MEKETAVAAEMQGPTITTSETVANYEEKQHLQTRVEALKEN